MTHGYRFVKVATVYPSFAEEFRTQEPDSGTRSYHELVAAVIGSRYGLSDFYARRLTERGNVAREIFDLDPLLRAWAREHGLGSEGDQHGLLLRQIRDFRPDVIYLQDLYRFDRDFRAELRSEVPMCKVLGWRAAPTDDFGSFRDLDLVLSSSSSFVRRFREAGVRAELLPHAFAPEILREMPPAASRITPVSFLGTVGRHDSVHARRREVIERLLAHTPLHVWGAVSDPPARSRTWRWAARNVFWANHFLEALGVGVATRRRIPLVGRGATWASDPTAASAVSVYPDRVHSPVFGLDYFRVLGQSQITVNVHSQATGSDAANMRLFEATGMGACLVTDAQADLDHLFDVDREVVVFDTPEDCVEKVHHLLDHPVECQAIAAAGQARTLASHTYDHQVPLLDAWIRELLDT